MKNRKVKQQRRCESANESDVTQFAALRSHREMLIKRRSLYKVSVTVY